MDAQALGRYLRQTRETKELTLTDAEQSLKIRSRILESFELGDFNIPDSNNVQLRGFMRNYARFLGLDEDRVLQYYDAALVNGERQQSLLPRPRRKKNKRETQPTHAAPVSYAPRTITDTQPILPPLPTTPLVERRRSSGSTMLNLLVRMLVALAALSVIIFVAVQLIGPNFSVSETSSTPSNILGQLPPTLTVTLGASATPLPLPTVPQTQTNYAGQGLLVEIEMVQRAWLSISADGVQQYEGIARPGEQMQYSALDNITMTTSSGEALNVIYNGQRQPTLGARGQRVDVVFRMSGVEISTGPGFAPTPIESNTPLPTPTDPQGTLIAQQTPSATEGPSPTASNTPTITNTPTVTFTPSLTFTPSETPTITQTPSNTVPPTNTFTASPPPSDTPLPTATYTPSITPTPSPTAILPPREPAVEPSPTKEGASSL
jgi:hypothetical protein